MILTATINEVKRRVTFDNPNAVVAVKGDYEVNGVAFAFPAIYEDDFDLSTAVKTVYYKATDGIIYNHVVTDTDTDTGYPLWVFKDEINKGAYGDVEFALVCDKVEGGNIVKRWVSMITAFRVQRSIPIDEAAQEDNEQTYSERLAYLMTQMANMQATVSGLASGAPTPVSLASSMTDTSKLYIYTGSESGYTAGHWYYYNGSAWADGGQYGGISVDTTLTVSGAAADAKVVGDEIAEIKEDLSQIENYNIYDVLQKATRADGTSGGITWTWNDDGSCRAVGTASAVSARLILGSSNSIPSEMQVGKKYYLKYNAQKVAFQIATFLAGNTVSDDRYYSDTEYIVPDNIDGLRIRLIVPKNTTVDETVNPILLSVFSDGVYESIAKAAATEEIGTAIIDDNTQWSFDGILRRTGYSPDEGADTYTCSDYLPVSPGDYIELIKCASTDDYYMCFFYDANNNYIGGVKTDLRYATYNTSYIVVPTGAAYMRAMVRKVNVSVARINKITDRITETPTSFGIKTLENYVAETGGRNLRPFANFKTTHRPLFTLIDDDTRNIHQVTDFYKVCNDNGIYGTSACITKYPMADEDLKNALLDSELHGHQTVFHCYDQFSNAHWTDETTYRDEILENVGTGIHHMNEMGFSDWKHWVTPAGVAGSLIKSLARRYGFSSITSITQNDYVGYDGYWNRWKIPRMELYPDDIGHSEGNTLEGIKAMIDKCVTQNGWLLVGVHLFQEVNYSSSFVGTKGWNNNDGQPNIYALDVQTAEEQARFEERFSRLYELITYAKNAGMDCVTLGEGISYWNSVFSLYESF